MEPAGGYLLIVVGEPPSDHHKALILHKVAKGLLSWDVEATGCDLRAVEAACRSAAAKPPESDILLQYSTETLAVEVLYNPLVSTAKQCLSNLLTAFTKHKHLIHAGYSFAGSGSWVLQNGVFTFEDFVDAFQEAEVQRILRNYPSINIHVHCPAEGKWSVENLKKQSPQFSRVHLNPTDCCDSVPGSQALLQFLDRTIVSSDVREALQASTVVGNIKFNRPTLYIFPGGQGDCALFGINGFNMLVDGGFNKRPCFWDFIRHLDRLDAVMVTRLSETNCSGITTMMKRKVVNHVYPQLGYVFCNVGDAVPEEKTKDSEELLMGVMSEGHKLAECLKLMNLPPHPCYRETIIEPFVLYQKVGHGTLDMYILNPPKDSREIKEFFQQWRSNRNDFGNVKCGLKMKDQELNIPLSHFLSISALLVWRPVKPTDPITRILFTGSTPQNKLFEAFEKLKFLDILKHRTCTQSKLQPKQTEKPKMKTEKFAPKTFLTRQSTHSPSGTSPSPKSTGTSTPKKESPAKPAATKAPVEIAKAASRKLSQVSQAKKPDEKRSTAKKETKPVIIPKEKNDAKKNGIENKSSAAKTSRLNATASAKKSPENKESSASTPKEETAKSKMSATTLAKNKINKTKSATTPPSKPASKPKPSDTVKKVPSKVGKKPENVSSEPAKPASKPKANGTTEEPKKINGHAEEQLDQVVKEEKTTGRPIVKEEEIKKETKEAVSKELKIDRSAIENIARNLTSLNDEQKYEEQKEVIPPTPQQVVVEAKKDAHEEFVLKEEEHSLEKERQNEEITISETIPEPVEENIVEAPKKVEEVASEPPAETNIDALEFEKIEEMAIEELTEEKMPEEMKEEGFKEEFVQETKGMIEEEEVTHPEHVQTEELSSDQQEELSKMCKDSSIEISEVAEMTYPEELEVSTKPVVDFPPIMSQSEPAKEPDATYSIVEDVDASSYDIAEVESISIKEEEEASLQEPEISFSEAASESIEAPMAMEKGDEGHQEDYSVEDIKMTPESPIPDTDTTKMSSTTSTELYMAKLDNMKEMGEKLIEKDIRQNISPIPVETYPDEGIDDKSQEVTKICLEETKEKKYYSDEKDEDTKEDIDKPFDEEYETMAYEDQQACAQRESVSPTQDDSERQLLSVSPPRTHLDSNKMKEGFRDDEDDIDDDDDDEKPIASAYKKTDAFRKEEFSDEESSNRSDDEDSNIRMEKEAFGSLIDSNVTAEAASSGDDGIDMTIESPKGEDFFMLENKQQEEKHYPLKSETAIPSSAQYVAGDECSDDKSSKDDISKDEISKDFSTEDLSKEVDELYGNASEFLPNIRDNNLRASEEHASQPVSYHLNDGSFENAAGMDPMMTSFIKEDIVDAEKEVDECKDKVDKVKHVEEFVEIQPDDDSNFLTEDVEVPNDDGIDDEYSLSCQDDVSMYQVVDKTSENLSTKEFESNYNLEKEVDNFETKDPSSDELKPSNSESPRLSVSSKEDLQEKELLHNKQHDEHEIAGDGENKGIDDGDDDYSDDGEIIRHATPPGEQNFYQNIGPVGPLNELQGSLMEQYLASGLARPLMDVTEQPLYEEDSEDEGKSPIVEQPIYASAQVADFPEFVTLSGGTTPSEPQSPKSPLDARGRLGSDDQMKSFHESATMLPPVSEDASDSAGSSPIHRPIKGVDDSYNIIYNKAFVPQLFPKEDPKPTDSCCDDEMMTDLRENVGYANTSGQSSPSVELADPKDVMIEEEKVEDNLPKEGFSSPGSKNDLDLDFTMSQSLYGYNFEHDAPADFRQQEEQIESPEDIARPASSEDWKFENRQEHRRTGSIAKCENDNKTYNDADTPSEITPESPEHAPNPAMTSSFYEEDVRCRGYQSADMSDEIGQSMVTGSMADFGREGCRSPYEDVLERNRKLRLSDIKKDGSSVESPEEVYPKSQSDSSLEASSEDDSPTRRRHSPQSYTNKGYIRDDSEDNPIDDYPMQDQPSSTKWSPDTHHPAQEFHVDDSEPRSGTAHQDFHVEDWDKPMGLPTPPQTPLNGSTPGSPAKRMRPTTRGVAKPKINPIYVDLAYVPHHGDPNYSNVEFFDHIRARYYVLSGTNPSKEVLNALLEAKKGWKDESEVTIIPTYETDTLGYWMALNQETLTALNIDVAPSASRCTVNLQDHETSCAAYRLEF